MPEYHEAKQLSAEIAQREELEDPQQPFFEAGFLAIRPKLRNVPREEWYVGSPLAPMGSGGAVEDAIGATHPAEVRDLLLLRLRDPKAFWALLPGPKRRFQAGGKLAMTVGRELERIDALFDSNGSEG